MTNDANGLMFIFLLNQINTDRFRNTKPNAPIVYISFKSNKYAY